MAIIPEAHVNVTMTFFISLFRLSSRRRCPDSYLALALIREEKGGEIPNVVGYAIFFSPKVNCFAMSLSGSIVWKMSPAFLHDL